MAFPVHTMRKDPHTGFQTSAAFFKSLIWCTGDQFHIRPLLQKILDRSLIFQLTERTGGIEKFSSRPQHICRIQNNLSLKLTIIFRSLLFPVCHHPRLLAEHSFPGTRCVYQNLIKKLRQYLRQFLRCFTGYINIGNSHQFQILQQRFCPAATDIISKKQSFPVQFCTKFGRFSSRCRTQIQHIITRFRRQTVGRCHRTRFLQIIQSRIIIRIFRRCTDFVRISVVDPGYFFQQER